MGEATYPRVRAEFERRREAGRLPLCPRSRSTLRSQLHHARNHRRTNVRTSPRPGGQNTVSPIMMPRMAREASQHPRLSKRLAAQGHRGSSELLRPDSWPAGFGRNRKNDDASSHPRRRGKERLYGRRFRSHLEGSRAAPRGRNRRHHAPELPCTWRKSPERESRRRSICTCWMSRALPARSRCERSLKSSIQTTGFS